MDWKPINIAPEIVAKYLAKGKTPPSKPKQEWVTRYHRTKTENAPSIEQSGLLTYNPNIGNNTYLSNKADYHKIWLADNPREIPVLRQLMAETPQDVTTYKVRMPKSWYMESPRFYMPKGRGNAVMKRTPADKIRLTDEGKYKIDLLGRDIPPEYLQKLPAYKANNTVADDRSDAFFDLALYNIDDIPYFNITDPKDVQKLPKRLRAEAKTLSKDLEANDYHYFTTGLAPSDELIAATVSPVRTAHSIIDRAKRESTDNLSRSGYPYTSDELRDWTKSSVGTDLAVGAYGTEILDTGLPAIPELKSNVDRYLSKYAGSADEDAVGTMYSWIKLGPRELANFWIDSELPAITNKNTLTDQDVLPVFSQIKHKLMVPDDRYENWPRRHYAAYKPTDDINFRAAATLLEALQRSDRKDLLPQAREILFNNLEYYK